MLLENLAHINFMVKFSQFLKQKVQLYVQYLSLDLIVYL